jgi:hypothetical protein
MAVALLGNGEEGHMLRIIWGFLFLYVTANVLLVVYLFWRVLRELVDAACGARWQRDEHDEPSARPYTS